jgi:hypothetical protein
MTVWSILFMTGEKPVNSIESQLRTELSVKCKKTSVAKASNLKKGV